MLRSPTLLAALLFAAVPAAAQHPEPHHSVQLRLATSTKQLCSALFVSGRDIDEALENSVLGWPYLLISLEARGVTDFDPDFDVDRDTRVVTTSWRGVTVRARHFGDQGCIILPDGTDQVMFTPVEVTTTLSSAASLPWPMGDAEPDGPIPAGIDTDDVARAVDVVFERPEDNTAGFLVIYEGRIVGERYGPDAHPHMQLESWSMGKSLTATLLGLLVQQGHIDVDAPAPIAEWRNRPGDPRAAIRTLDLLRMSSGLRMTHPTYSTPEELEQSYIPGHADHSLAYAMPMDAFQFAISRPLEHPPNTVGRYRNADPLSLGLIIKRTVQALGEEYLTWPQRALFDRIGIREQILETDLYGNFVLTGFDYGTPRNWARIALLYQQDGVWNGERLLPEGWAELVSTPAPAWEDGRYGGQFWINAERRFNLPLDAYFMNGGGGQHVILVPSHDLIIVRMGHAKGSIRNGHMANLNRALGMLMDAVEPGWTPAP